MERDYGYAHLSIISSTYSGGTDGIRHGVVLFGVSVGIGYMCDATRF